MRTGLYLLTALLFFAIEASSQEADKTKGCVPLTVTFSAPSSSEYYWEFGDNVSSALASPKHIYTDSGSYVAVLYTDATKSIIVGELSIDVYSDITINLTSDKTEGCNPETINFNNEIIKNNDIVVSGLLWTFGDGNSSQLAQPSHTYTNLGSYDVSLQVNTNYAECNKTIINEKMITIDEPTASFDIDKTSTCDVPATFTIINNSSLQSDYNYLWDFGNGTVSTEYNPEPMTYTERGSYSIQLSIIGSNGCTHTKRTNITVGGPLIDMDIIDTTCVDTPISIDNLSEGATHLWNFGEDASPEESTLYAPVFRYKSPGLKTVTYKVTSGDCDIDTSFTILIPEKLSAFSVSQGSVCDNPGVLNLTADYPGLGDYYWNESRIKSNDSIMYEFINPPRDSNYINEPELIDLSLIVKTPYRCRDTSKVEFELQLPEAFFIPDSIIGLAPLTITFSDHSESSDSIIERHWHFDDGSNLSVPGDITQVTHTFDKAGRYFVKLAIENQSGCSDWSKGTWIEAIEFKQDNNGSNDDPDDGQCEGFNSGDPSNFCIGNSFSWGVNGRAAFDFHINTDEGRFDHCWKNRIGRYAGKFPGEYPISVDIEYKGFLIDKVNLPRPLIIPGTRAEINYEKNCSDIYVVSLESQSLNYSKLQWKYNDQIISQDEKFDFTFSEKGIHKIYLEAHGDDSLCAPHIDSVSIHVTEPIAVIDINDKICDNIAYSLDASQSSDIHMSCGNNILWEFNDQRPRAVNDSIVDHVFLPGRQSLSLTVTDINGCTDSVSKDIHVYGNELSFVLDTSICFPNDAHLLNTSVNDTTVIGWSWSFGSEEQSPNYTFTEQDLHQDKRDTVAVILSMIDALGCVDTVVQYAARYIPNSHITLAEDHVCVGSDVEVRARDYNKDGSYLNFEWDFGEAGNGNSQEETIQYTTKGLHTIRLYYEEEGSGCNGSLTKNIKVFDRPIAEFSSSVDSLEVICYPHTVAFSNLSFTDGPVDYEWTFGDGSQSGLKNPAITYDKGEYTAVLTVLSEYGCSDHTEVTYDLVGPSGNLVIDDNTLCVGQEVEIQLYNPDDITEYNWDFGDGTVITDQNPVMHHYTSTPEGGRTTIDLVIKSAETGCEAIKSVPVRIQDVKADFSSSVDSMEHICFPHQVSFDNNSVVDGPPVYAWRFGDGTSSSSTNPTKTYDKGFYNVSLIAETSFGCLDTIHKSYNVIGPSALMDIDNDKICIGESVVLNISDLDDVAYYSWDFGDGTIVDNVSPFTHTYTDINNDGTMDIQLQLMSDTTECITEQTISVQIHDIYADFSQVEGNDYCYGTIELENNSIGADTFIWDLGNGDASDDIDLLYTYDSLSTYQVMLIAAHNQTGCVDTTFMDIQPTAGDHFYDFPNVFSPNGDGNNDRFNVVINPNYQDVVELNNMEIYNRWGKLVYSSSDISGWDGTLNGSYLESDVYAYLIEMSIKDCTTIQKKGNVTLLK